MLKEAIEKFTELARAGTQAKGRADMIELNSQYRLLVNPDGTTERIKNIRDYSGDVPGLQGIADAVKALPRLDSPIYVRVWPDCILISALASPELNLAHTQIKCNLPRYFNGLNQTGGPCFFTQEEMIRHIRTTRLMKDMHSVRQVLRSLDAISWKTESTHDSSGVGASRASYGSAVQQEAAPKEEDLLTESVVSFRYLEDQACPTSGLVNCFWEYDHGSRRVALTPYGGEIEDICVSTFNWLEDWLTEQLEETSAIVLRGTE
jgi:hypothetical protein